MGDNVIDRQQQLIEFQMDVNDTLNQLPHESKESSKRMSKIAKERGYDKIRDYRDLVLPKKVRQEKEKYTESVMDKANEKMAKEGMNKYS